MQDIYKIGKQMEKNYKRVNLYERKKASFGLTEEEERKLKEYRNQSWLLHEELIETHLNISVMPNLITKEYNDAFEFVNNMIAWNGGFIRKDEEFNDIFERVVKLNKGEKQLLADKLEFMHILILQRFELFCSSEEGYEHIREASKVITIEEDGNILDVLVYLDARYRELAELLDIELQEVEVMWEDD